MLLLGGRAPVFSFSCTVVVRRVLVARVVRDVYKRQALHSGRTRRSGICPLCAERKLPGIGGQNLLQGYPCCYRKRKRVETVPGNSLRTAPYSVKGAKGVEKFRERGESHGILRKAGMMITEVMKISEPPYTNRGVTRQKEDLTALIDWCQITVKGVDVFIIIEDILRIPLSFMEPVSYTHLDVYKRQI